MRDTLSYLEVATPKRLVSFLVVYRWISLIPPLVAVLQSGQRPLLLALAAAAGANLIISLQHDAFNRALRQRPWILLADLLLMAGLIAVSGDWGATFYLHALNPALIAAFLFGLRGAMMASSTLLVLYFVALALTPAPINWLLAATAVVGAYLISGTVGFAATLMARLQQEQMHNARQKAVHEERLRIAQDLHDTVSQTLFGIVLTLDGCLSLLPHDTETAVPELERALTATESVRADIRHTILDIWPTTLTAARFTADLQQYAENVCPTACTDLTFDIRGDFGALSPLARRSLYRISQEALNNIAHHAEASEAKVCVDVADGRAQLVIRDNGRGFDPQQALSHPTDHDHFGLPGIMRRAESLGGRCHIFSRPGAGASLVVDIPVNGTP